MLCAEKWLLLQWSPKKFARYTSVWRPFVFNTYTNLYIYTQTYIYITSSAAHVFIVWFLYYFFYLQNFSRRTHVRTNSARTYARTTHARTLTRRPTSGRAHRHTRLRRNRRGEDRLNVYTPSWKIIRALNHRKSFSFSHHPAIGTRSLPE